MYKTKSSDLSVVVVEDIPPIGLETWDDGPRSFSTMGPVIFLPPKGIQGFSCKLESGGVVVTETVPIGSIIGLTITSKKMDTSYCVKDWLHPVLSHARLAPSALAANLDWVGRIALVARTQISCGTELLLNPDSFTGEFVTTPPPPPVETHVETKEELEESLVSDLDTEAPRRCRKRVRFSYSSSLDFSALVPSEAISTTMRSPTSSTVSGTFTTPCLTKTHPSARVKSALTLVGKGFDVPLNLTSCSSSGLFGWPLSIESGIGDNREWRLRAQGALPVGAVLGSLHLIPQAARVGGSLCPQCCFSVENKLHTITNAFRFARIQSHSQDPGMESYVAEEEGNLRVLASSLVIVIRPVAAGDDLVWSYQPHSFPGFTTARPVLCDYHDSTWTMMASEQRQTALVDELLDEEEARKEAEKSIRRKSVPVFSLFSAEKIRARHRNPAC